VTSEQNVRRAITVPALFVAFACSVALAPVLAVSALLVDVARAAFGTSTARWPTTRAVVFFLAYLVAEAVGVTIATGAWVSARVRGIDEETFLRWNFRLQCGWTSALYRAAVWIYGLKIEVHGSDVIAPGPILLFMRHTSVADTVLPGVLVSNALGIRLRYVLKRELLVDPCLDIVGLRLRNHFVRRGVGDAATEIAAVGALARDLRPDEGVLIYPEGTRYSERGREQRVARLVKSGDPLAEQAAAFRQVLPPHLGGPLALIEEASKGGGAAIVFCAHVGFEGAATLPRFLAGALVGARVQVAFWRVPLAEVPASDEARRGWLYEEWKKIDDWVVAHAR